MSISRILSDFREKVVDGGPPGPPPRTATSHPPSPDPSGEHRCTRIRRARLESFADTIDRADDITESISLHDASFKQSAELESRKIQPHPTFITWNIL